MCFSEFSILTAETPNWLVHGTIDEGDAVN